MTTPDTAPLCSPSPSTPASSTYDARGVHVLVDLHDADPRLLMDADFLMRHATDAARQAGATVLQAHAHHFGDGMGVAGVVLLAESHLTFHTWPEHRFAALDAFMCGACRPHAAMQHMAHALKASKITERTVRRANTSECD